MGRSKTFQVQERCDRICLLSLVGGCITRCIVYYVFGFVYVYDVELDVLIYHVYNWDLVGIWLFISHLDLFDVLYFIAALRTPCSLGFIILCIVLFSGTTRVYCFVLRVFTSRWMIFILWDEFSVGLREYSRVIHSYRLILRITWQYYPIIWV